MTSGDRREARDPRAPRSMRAWRRPKQALCVMAGVLRWFVQHPQAPGRCGAPTQALGPGYGPGILRGPEQSAGRDKGDPVAVKPGSRCAQHSARAQPAPDVL